MRENQRETRGLEIDLQKLLLAYLRKWWLILICAVAGGALALVVTLNFITPLYRASVTVYVNNNIGGQQVESISNTNLATSQKLVNTYVNIIGSDTVLSKVVEYRNLPYSPDQIRKMMSASQRDETEIFTVSISNPNPKMAAVVANAIAEVAPEKIGEIVEGSSTKIIDYAKEPTEPYSPNVRNNLILGVLIGAVVALACATIMFLMDVRIKSAEDLDSLFGYPVLGQIPEFQAPDLKKMNAYAYGDSNGKGAQH